MKTDISIENYTAKSFVLLGNTKKYKDDIKLLGGKFNCNLKDNKVGWIFPVEKKDQVEKWLKSDNILEKSEIKNDLEQTLKEILGNQKLFLKNQEKIMKTQQRILKVLDIINDNDEKEQEDQDGEIPIRLLKRN
tara:strand:- start:117 stop:518 length:402 start_codon:yes stop_codon:yes gene_type:complete